MSSVMHRDEITKRIKGVQKHISQWLEKTTGQTYKQDEWTYEKGSGGGVTRIWEAGDDLEKPIESGGVNFSGILGESLPEAALAQLASKLNVKPDSPTTYFYATGVSLVIHPRNPHVPTIHMNIRYFETDNTWWFGGGIDLTPYYPRFDEVVQFHNHLRSICETHQMPYDTFKKLCDDYFYLKHRHETRGIGGIFFDHLQSPSKSALLDFICDLGTQFTDIYGVFMNRVNDPVTPVERNFQLLRRSRYVEFNLLWDRGTKFGIQSQGRTESILMSLPTLAKWQYDWNLDKNSVEYKIVKFYLQPKDWFEVENPGF